MRKIYIVTLLTLFFNIGAGFAQQAYIKAPSLPTTTTNVRAMNGTTNHVTFRGCYLLTASELATIGTNTAINAIGFYLNSGTSGTANNGNIQVYLQNTNDVSYSKGTNWTTAISPMTSMFNNTINIPTGGASTITIPFPSNFTYTGGGIYVAFDWVTTGPFGTNLAVYQADNTMASAGAANSTTIMPASNNLTASNIRPVFRVGYVNTYTNEAETYGVLGNGLLPLIGGSPYSFSVIVRNNAGVAMTNITPTLSISGANTFSATTTIASLAAGATVTATFPSYTPTAQGMNTVNVSLPSDENNTNNSVSVTQSVTCNYISAAPPSLTGNFTVQGVGINAPSYGLLLSRVSVASTSTLNAIKLGIYNSPVNVGNSIYGVITNEFGSIIATTNTMAITGAMLGAYQTFTFATPVTMNGGTQYMIGMAQPQNTLTPYFPMASVPSPSNNIPYNLYYNSWLNGGFTSIQTPTLGWMAIQGVLNSGVSLSVTPQTSTICSGNSVSISASGATTYSWSNGAATNTINVNPALYTAYTCTGSAVVGTVGVCTDIKTAVVYVNLTPTISCPNGAICPVGGTHTLNPSGAATYTFSSGAATVNPVSNTNYTITGTSAAGCPASNTVVATVSVSSSPSVAIVGPTLICVGESPVLAGSGAINYTWSTASTYSSIIVNPFVTTTYSLVGAFGSCTGSAAITITVSPNPQLSAQTSNDPLCIGETATLSAFGAETYTWSSGNTGLTTMVSPSVETTYTLTGAINGICQQSITITQSVISCVGIEQIDQSITELKIYPNPNNGTFKIYVSSVTPSNSYEIINTLGQMILSGNLNDNTTEIDLRKLQKGAYFIKLKDNDSAIKTQKIIIN